jgi:hypothetical protein
MKNQMKKLITFLIILMTLSSCTTHKIVKEYYSDGKLAVEKIYPNKKDTLSYLELKYFPTGELFSRFNYNDGHPAGGFADFTPKGIIIKRGTYEAGKLVGVLQEYDTTGILARETYYINDKKVIYSYGWHSKNKEIFGQDFFLFKNDTSIYRVGQILKKLDGSFIKNMSAYSLIISNDTILESSYCFDLRTFFPIPCNKYEISFGTPNTNLEFNKVDTSFTTADSLIKICNYKFHKGMNHVFCKVIAYSVDKADTAKFFAFKDVFVK